MNTILRVVLLFGVIGQLSAAKKYTVVENPFAPEQAARTMRVPPGFKVTLFAGEPDVKQPIGFCIDDRGRLWVAEAYSYPKHSTEGKDRILIFEDTNQDGRFDKRTVFYDKLNYVSGIEVGFGGAWVMSPPYFYFIPDGNHDDVPDGDPIVLLDGFGTHANSHNIANGFSWGPDGWLYGTHGRTNYSWPDKPGTPKDQRRQYDGGVWRYHPIRHIWEPFADGTTNPWGIDWNDYGEGFVCNCVNPHLFHVIQGAHYEPGRNRVSSRYAYERIPTIADHRHFVGGNNVRDGLGTPQEDLLGGGHAHSGTMVYLGDNWPDRYRNTVFMNNIHGRRINHDILIPKGSGYTATHSRDLMKAQDPWFMGVTIRFGPDGGVYSSDWSDTGECHSTRNTRKHTGRLFKITYGKPKPFTLDLPRLSNSELVDLQLHKNDWMVRHARRLLQERYAFGMNMDSAAKTLLQMYRTQTETPKKLRALWALKVINRLDDEFLMNQIQHKDEHIRSWAIRLLCEDRDPPEQALGKFRYRAAEGTSQVVRLQLASALQRLKPEQRWPIGNALIQRGEDTGDQNLPLMYWYGIQALAEVDVNRFANLALTAKIPLIREHIARRASSLVDEKGVKAMASTLTKANPAARSDILAGMLKGLEGRRSAVAPGNWSKTYADLRRSKDTRIRRDATRLALIFNDPVALQTLRSDSLDVKLDSSYRNEAIRALVQKKAKDLSNHLVRLLDDKGVRQAAIKGLAAFDDPATPGELLKRYAAFDHGARMDALQTLASRKAWAEGLLSALEKKQILRRDVSSYTARQILSFGDRKLNARLERAWGQLNNSSKEKQKQIESFRKRLTEKNLARANREAGHELFKVACAVCHKLFEDGNDVGPELTGAQRDNLDYLLENIIDPSASVARDYQMQIVDLKDGRTISGFPVSQNANAITVRTLNDRVIIPHSDIARTTQTQKSIMPDGLLQALSSEQVRDLIAFLQSGK